jgi:hypothetical protein
VHLVTQRVELPQRALEILDAAARIAAANGDSALVAASDGEVRPQEWAWACAINRSACSSAAR